LNIFPNDKRGFVIEFLGAKAMLDEAMLVEYKISNVKVGCDFFIKGNTEFKI